MWPRWPSKRYSPLPSQHSRNCTLRKWWIFAVWWAGVLSCINHIQLRTYTGFNMAWSVVLKTGNIFPVNLCSKKCEPMIIISLDCTPDVKRPPILTVIFRELLHHPQTTQSQHIMLCSKKKKSHWMIIIV